LLKIKKNSKSKQNINNTPSLSKSDINSGIIYLELNENCSIRSYETGEELKDIILSYTKSISEYAIKHDLAENMLFCESIEKSYKIGKEGQGLLNLWKNFLECLPSVSCDQAQAICATYPSPYLLKKAYDISENPSMLLADIQVNIYILLFKFFFKV
jgi:hypothetical protein